VGLYDNLNKAYIELYPMSDLLLVKSIALKKNIKAKYKRYFADVRVFEIEN